MASRMRRCTLTINGAAVSGVRDFTWDDNSEWNADRGDDEASGKFVRMSEGPYPFSFELLAPDANCASGYFNTLIATGKVITVADGAESSADKTLTLTGGYLKVGGRMNTETPGRIPVSGEGEALTGPS